LRIYKTGVRVKQVMSVEILSTSANPLRGKILKVLMQVDKGRTTLVETDAPFIGDTGTVTGTYVHPDYPGLENVAVDFDPPYNCHALMMNIE